jgi:hypothetical protein
MTSTYSLVDGDRTLTRHKGAPHAGMVGRIGIVDVQVIGASALSLLER